ncbi:hypothetical protein Hoch_3067 [Haliangium ochraceum DSM 14365]|uniref:Uncharacterized protein n=2 Tax=Haliangium ochraceum TaxID=80816 RepID=D0LR65_HALO1|nr:hypothetical protein Hoch_3067 [Haliangium ochraceum DSM 14365]
MLPRYGSAGALVGPIEDLLGFDRALLDGALLDDAARAELWRGQPALGYMALGQWSFELALAGCEAPVHVVERRGHIGAYQVRNLLLPASGLAVVAFTVAAGFEFGEPWTGQGASYALLSALACAPPAGD